jgi:hypothetical protein
LRRLVVGLGAAEAPAAVLAVHGLLADAEGSRDLLPDDALVAGPADQRRFLTLEVMTSLADSGQFGEHTVGAGGRILMEGRSHEVNIC